MVSFRTQAWQDMTSKVGQNSGYLVSQTGVANSGGTDAAQMISAFMNMGVGIAGAVMTSKAQASSAQQSAMTKATSGVTAGIQNYTTAKLQYDTANKELSDLQARKNNSGDSNINKLQGEIDELKGAYKTGVDGNEGGNGGLQAQYDTVQSEINTLKDQKTSLTNLQKVISENKALAEKNNSGKIGDIQITYTDNSPADHAVAELGKHKNDARYNKPNPEYDAQKNPNAKQTIFMQALYDADMQKANEMDAEQQKTIAAKKAVERAESEIKKLGLSDGTTPEAIDAQIKTKENELAGISNKSMTGSSNGAENGQSLTFGQYKAKLDGLEKQLAQAENDKDDKSLDGQIKKKTDEVDSKRTKMEGAKTSLLNLKAQLLTQKQQMESLSDDSGVKSAKNEYKASKKSDKRNFFQKMFGTGKSQGTKDAKQAYKDVKNKQKADNSTFTAMNGYSASKANINQIEAQIKMIDNALASNKGQ